MHHPLLKLQNLCMTEVLERDFEKIAAAGMELISAF